MRASRVLYDHYVLPPAFQATPGTTWNFFSPLYVHTYVYMYDASVSRERGSSQARRELFLTSSRDYLRIPNLPMRRTERGYRAAMYRPRDHAPSAPLRGASRDMGVDPAPENVPRALHHFGVHAQRPPRPSATAFRLPGNGDGWRRSAVAAAAASLEAGSAPLTPRHVALCPAPTLPSASSFLPSFDQLLSARPDDGVFSYASRRDATPYARVRVSDVAPLGRP